MIYLALAYLLIVGLFVWSLCRAAAQSDEREQRP